MLAYLQENQQRFNGLNFRIGMNAGPVVAGVVGTHYFDFDLWCDAVNVASRMESHGVSGRIQLTSTIYERLHQFIQEDRGQIGIKGKGEMNTWFLVNRKPTN
ncbi:MAG: hypothetical protein IH840_09815 [Candidatus Heimdallarchaeota archaeon]|nr:hypothetical protein [Candidatus Heimdallarchaeota archaeon]